MEISELKSIIKKSGLSAYKIEKDLKISNGTLGQVLKGKKVLPEKYEEPLRSLVPSPILDLNVIEKLATGEETDFSKAIVNLEEIKKNDGKFDEKIDKINNYAHDNELGEIDLNEYEKMEADSDKFVGEVLGGENVNIEWANDERSEVHIVTNKDGRFKKEVKRPLMDIADLL